MWKSLTRVVSDSSLRVAAITLFCLGFTYASTVPYQSIIGINQLGLSEANYALLLLAIAIAGMIGSLALGYLSDRARDRKTSILIVLAIGMIGYGGFSFFPSLLSFMICLLLVVPISGSAFSLLFAVVRAKSQEHGSREAASINSVVRTFYAVSWIVVPGLVGLFVATRKNTSDSYTVAAAAFALCFVIYAFFGDRTQNTQTPQSSAWSGFKTALGLIAGPAISLRILSLALIAIPLPVNDALLPLFITHLPHGTTADIGVIAGLKAALEIPFMVLGAFFIRRFSIWKTIAGGGLVHGFYLLALGYATSTTQVYLLTVLNAAGAAIVLVQHINYMQDLMPDRPGLGTSLLSIGSVFNKGIGALVFASAGTIIGFSGAAWFGAALTVAGSCGLYMLDRKRT
jgi:predicted MFS family arabinose efflux permease